ncbi:hypothetical protein D049_3388A, partial [Vibrio parahaemolyticus VPTS-2010]
MVVYN